MTSPDASTRDRLLDAAIALFARQGYSSMSVADIQHIILACGRRLNWRRLCQRFRGHERVLLAHVALFGYIFPGEASSVPRSDARR